MNNFILWLAQGFGSGRIPFAPGTFGSLVGLFWFVVLLSAKSLLIFWSGIILSIPLSIWLCGRAENILNQKDPGSVVIDEIVAIPLCFASWLLALHFQKNVWPSPEYFFTSSHWSMTLAVFILFRIFDVLKPWPVRQSQSLPGGWGVTIDDLLAAVYVNLVIILLWILKPDWF